MLYIPLNTSKSSTTFKYLIPHEEETDFVSGKIVGLACLSNTTDIGKHCLYAHSSETKELDMYTVLIPIVRETFWVKQEVCQCGGEIIQLI